MNSDHDTHRWVGCPIRISTDQSLLAAPHGFSQRATSFIASWCQGIHRMPLSRSKQPTHAQEQPTPRDCPIFLLCWPPDAPVCASGAHGPTAAALRFSTETPYDSAQRNLEQSLTGNGQDLSLHSVIQAHTLTLLSAPLSASPPLSGQTPQQSPRTETHQPLHTDKEHTSDNRQDSPAHAGPTPTIVQSPGFPVTIAIRSPTHRVEADGIEPTTPCLQSRCSTN